MKRIVQKSIVTRYFALPIIVILFFCCYGFSVPITDEEIQEFRKELLFGKIEKMVTTTHSHVMMIDNPYEYSEWFDESGNVIKTISQSLGDRSLPIYYETSRKYDQRGRLLSMVMSDDHEWEREIQYFYANDRVDFVVISKKDTLYYEYDQLGRLLVGGGVEWTKAYYEYDSLGRVTSYSSYEDEAKYFYEPDGSYREVVEDGGKEVTFFYKDGVPQKIEYYIDGEGHLPPYKIFIYSYVYDEQGNWTETYLTDSATGEEKLHKSRSITYRTSYYRFSQLGYSQEATGDIRDHQ